MGVWDIVDVVADTSLFVALGLSGDLYGDYKVSRWIYTGVDEMIEDSNGNRTYKCGICGVEGHNRRTCQDNVTCGGCGNEEPDEVWEEGDNIVCNYCL